MGHSELTALNNPQTELVILGLSENAGNRNLEVPPAVVLVLDVHASSLRSIVGCRGHWDSDHGLGCCVSPYRGEARKS